MTENACVLYVDHQGHPAPLSRCFHATASRRLSSSIDRHPPSTKTEVDSAYCPQCLSFHDAATAASLGHCATCKQCPLCMGVASVAIDNGTAFFKCGYCSWTSHDCQVTASVTVAEDGSIGKDQLLQATQDVAAALESKLDDSGVEIRYKDMLSAWEKVVKGGRSLPKQEKRMRQKEDAWSLQALEESIRTKQEKAPALFGNAQRVSCEEQPLDASLDSLAPTCLLLQPLASSFSSPMSRQNLLPLPLPLRARKSRRCRAELAQGRPGILVKPKLNPLEGDTSLRSGHGQWWKKDSTAIHVVPLVTVVKRVNGNFLLKVSNPTMGMVRLRFGPSTLQNARALKQVLIDSLKVSYADITLNPEATSTLKSSEFVQLESVQDSFLELGKSSRSRLPEAVASWTPTAPGDSPSIQLVTSYKDTAWLELILTLNDYQQNQVWTAAPITLQIQVGEGSWESSLIKCIPSERPDLVTFDIFIAWETTASD